MSVKSNIGVAVPAYSRPELLAQLVSSIPDSVKIFVSDNGQSMKGTELRLGGNVVVSHSETLIPMFANWNRAVSLVDESITHVLIPSDDDLYLPRAFEYMAQAIADNDDADIFVFGCDLVDEEGNIRKGYAPLQPEVLDEGRGFLKFALGVDARMPGVMFRKSFLDRIGAFDEQFELTAADSDLIQRALLLGKAVFLPPVVGLYRVWAGSLTHSRQATDQWMNEIDLWVNKIVRIIKQERQPIAAALDLTKFKDEIVARNLLAGIGGLINRHEDQTARDFLKRHPIPASANIRTKFSIVRRRLILWKRSFA